MWSKAAAEALTVLYKCEWAFSPIRNPLSSPPYPSPRRCARCPPALPRTTTLCRTLLTISDTRARPPSRTLVDPLEAFVASLPSKGLSASADDAHAAADKTKELVAKAGRGAYVNQEELKKREVPDPGAWGIWRVVDGLRGYEA